MQTGIRELRAVIVLIIKHRKIYTLAAIPLLSYVSIQLTKHSLIHTKPKIHNVRYKRIKIPHSPLALLLNVGISIMVQLVIHFGGDGRTFFMKVSRNEPSSRPPSVTFTSRFYLLNTQNSVDTACNPSTSTILFFADPDFAIALTRESHAVSKTTFPVGFAQFPVAVSVFHSQCLNLLIQKLPSAKRSPLSSCTSSGMHSWEMAWPSFEILSRNSWLVSKLRAHISLVIRG